ncbi:MAG: DEAD/DEAH box helicase [Thermoplasmata archaeon]
MNIEELDIPEEAKKVIVEMGIQELYPPQEECIDDVIEGKNCVLAFPTASGKSLLAYIAIMKKVLEEGGKALYIVPLRALASEKVRDLKKFSEVGIKVAVSMGNYDRPDPNLKDYDVIVATSEKADSLLRQNIDWIHDLNVVIADEVHLVNDRERGSTLEVTLTKLNHVNPDAQIIALSATINNSEAVAGWLDAEHHKSEWRPVDLRSGVYLDGTIRYDDNGEEKVSGGNKLYSICRPVLEKGEQCLVFVSTRRSTESVSRSLAGNVDKILKDDEKEELKKVSQDILDRSTTSIGKKLAELVASGIAFHNAGLNNYQRKRVEDAFRARLIKLIVATPTLAAGINMPARRVVIRDYRRYDSLLGYNAPIPVLEIKQMCGRAGRPGYDDIGEAVIMARNEGGMRQIFENYIMGESEVIVSRMATEPSLRRHLLALIATTHCRNQEDILDFMGRTFYAQHSDIWTIEDRINKTLQLLKEKELITQDEERWKATLFGKRVSDLYVDPLSAVIIREAVDRGKMGIPISYLHTISSTPDMYNLFINKTEMAKYEKKVRAVRADMFQDIPQDLGDLEYYLSSFKTACLLNDWIREVSEDEITKRYNIGPGDIRNKVETADWLLHSAAEIAKLYNKQKADMIHDINKRMKHGIKKELIPLTDIENVGRVRARILYDAGYKTAREVANASKEDLKALPGIGKKISSEVTDEEEEDGQVSLMDF